MSSDENETVPLREVLAKNAPLIGEGQGVSKGGARGGMPPVGVG